MPYKHSHEHGNNLADVCTKEEGNNLLDVCVYASAFLNCVNDGCKVIVGECHISRTLCNVGACNTHSTADVSRLKCRCIVNTVTCHRNNLPLFLPCFYNADFIFRGHSCINRDTLNLLCKLIFIHLVKLGTCYCKVALKHNAKLFCYSRSSNNVVACNHNRLDACLAANGYSFLCFGSRRVNHTHKTEECKSVFKLL